MGIIDDMENFIFDHFSVTKRHNVHQVIEITNNGSQQQTSSRSTSSSEVESHSSPRGQRSDHVISLSQPGQQQQQQTSTEQQQVDSHPHHQNQPNSPPAPMTRVQSTFSISPQNQVVTTDQHQHQQQQQLAGSPPSVPRVPTAPRRDPSNSPGSQRARNMSPRQVPVPSSPLSFRERVSWHERSSSRPPSSLSDMAVHSPQLEHRPLPSPIRTRHRASWVELSNLSSLENLTSAHLYNNSNNSRPPSAGPSSAIPAVESPTTPQKQNAINEHVCLPSTFRPEPRLSSLDRPAFMVAGSDLPQFGAKPQPSQPCSSNGVAGGLSSVVTKSVVKPKLVRLRSEPSSSSPPASAMGFPPIDPQSPQSAIRCRRRREELKRSQSLEVTSPSYQEELWTGINVPSQLVITRPQLSRSRLNRKHLSLQLEGMSEDLSSLVSDQPLTFHETHGDNIQLLSNKTRARRYESFCKGICFSNRPINVNERVYVKFVETNTTWSGVLRFGFTSVDPATVQGNDLPRYACPDLTNKPGNWAKALGELYTTSHILLRFSVSRTGDVTYAVNGEDKGLFFSGVDTSKDLWAMLDIYGNTVAVEFTHANAELELPNAQPQFDTIPTELINHSLSSISLRNGSGPLSSPTSSSPSSAVVQQAPGAASSPVAGQSPEAATPIMVRYHTGVQFSPLPLHTLQGRNIRVNPDRTVAVRLMEEYCNAFVFTSRPVRLGETLVIQVLGMDRSYIGGLGFGLTACDPSLVQPASLPDDSDLLLDRLEYWVVNKDVCRNPEVGDELSFHISNEGEVRYARNNNPAVTLMHVDRTLPLWAFFDVYGNIQKIKVLGATMTQTQGNLPRPQSMVNTYMNIANFDNHSASLNAEGAGSCYSDGNRSPGFSVAVPHSSPSQPQWPPRPGVGLTLRSNSVPEPRQGTPTADSKDARQKIPYPGSVPATPTGPDPNQQEDGGECRVCCERPVNCVLYTCGHMCLCYTCANVIRNQRGECPICRQRISDIIKVYRS